MRLNQRGNQVHDGMAAFGELVAAVGVRPNHDPFDGSRYAFDAVLTERAGWIQYDTRQDASYFGVWVNQAKRCTFTYCEGDMTFVQCPTLDSFRAELADMAEFYGPPPPSAVAIDADGVRTNYFDPKARPAV